MKNSNIIDTNFLTFLSGILIPTTHLSITSAFNAVPTATVTIPPFPQLYGLGRKDRLPVHIFVKDIVTGEYVMLFEGFVKSFSYANSNFGREMSINAHGIMSFLHDINVRFLSTKEAIAQANVPGAADTALQVVNLQQYFPMSLFMYGLGAVSEQNLIEFPNEYLDNIVKYISGGEGQYSVDQINDSALAAFYAKFVQLIALEARYSHVPHFDTHSEVWGSDKPSVFPLISGMQSSAIIETIYNIIGSQGDSSVLQLLNYLVNQMEYELAFFASPTYSPTLHKAAADGYNGDTMVCMTLKPVLFDAVPASCNIIYSSQTISINTIEEVYDVPTRVRTRDINSAFAQIAPGSSSVIKEFGTIDYYPSSYFMTDTDSAANTTGDNIFASELLDTETHTGPWVFETSAPAWMTYIGPAAAGANIKVFKERLLKRLLMHKQYEYRTLSVDSGFNYYITPGFPGVVFDSDDTNFIFCGHVMAVSHSISKTSVATNVQMGFVRLIDEAINNPVPNPVEGVELISSDPYKMSDITMQILGCPSLDFKSIKLMVDSEAQTDPMLAYKNQFRKIVTIKEYCDLVGLRIVEGIIGDSDVVPVELQGLFTTDRFVDKGISRPKFAHDKEGSSTDYTDIVDVLRTIAEKEFGNIVYTGGETFNHTRQKSENVVSTKEAMSAVSELKEGLAKQLDELVKKVEDYYAAQKSEETRDYSEGGDFGR